MSVSVGSIAVWGLGFAGVVEIVAAELEEVE